MRLLPRILATVTAGLLTAGGLVLVTPAAEAATQPSVSIATIKNRTAKYRKTVSVEVPKVTRKGNVELGTTSFTIKRGKKTVAKNKTSAKLKAGRYRVTTSARYRTWAMVTRTRSEQETYVAVPAYASVAARCTVQAATPPTEEFSSYQLELGCTSGDYEGSRTVAGTADGDEASGWIIAPLFTFDEAPVATEPAPLVGLVVDVSIYFSQDIVQTRTVTTSYRVKEFSNTRVAKRTQNLKIKQGAKPGRTDPVSTWNCPKWAPIKGNAQSMIYHLPSQRFYDRTKPEDCFSTQKAAKKAGYRKSKV